MDFSSIVAYIGPGVGLGSIILFGIIILVVLGSIVMVVWIPLKNFVKKVTHLFKK